MFFGEYVIAIVWSFTNINSDIPYRIEYVSNKWSCSCPAFSFRKTCKHLITLREQAKDKSLLNDRRYSLTDYGKEILKL